MTSAKDIIDYHNSLKAERASQYALWSTVAEHMDPFGLPMEGRVGDMSKIFSSRPMRAISLFSSMYVSLLMPRGSYWHTLAPMDERLRERDDVRRWADDMKKLLFRLRYAPDTGFNGLPLRMGRSLGLYGLQVAYMRSEATNEKSYQDSYDL